MAEVKKDKFIFKPYAPKELRELYGISYKTFMKWIEPFKDLFGEPAGGFYNEKQITLFVEKVGYPFREVEY